jgi:uncharacterized protein with ParB-like and HNH nuclease domain
MATKKINDVFNGRFFEIPKYQRGFAWDKENIRDLFEDIEESVETGSNHYIGTIVLSKSLKNDELFYIVDGQQRITSLTMIINSLTKRLDDADSLFYTRFYINAEGKYKLSPLGRDRDYFFSLLEGDKPKPENKSQSLMKSAYEEIENIIEAKSNSRKLLKTIEKLELMEFIETSEGDAIRIFQTVNDRGKPLSSMEKSKSLLIYFSNRYLDKKLDDWINDQYGEMFEIYDDIKSMGEALDVTLIKGKDFNEDILN